MKGSIRVDEQVNWRRMDVGPGCEGWNAAITRLPERLLGELKQRVDLLGLKIEGKIKSKSYIELPT